MITEPIYRLSTLFEQLGLPSTEEDMDAFIGAHQLPSDVSLAQADFWTPAQAGFLKEGWAADANWVDVIDELNVRLHA